MSSLTLMTKSLSFPPRYGESRNASSVCWYGSSGTSRRALLGRGWKGWSTVRSGGAAVVWALCGSPWSHQTQEYGDASLSIHSRPSSCHALECFVVSLCFFAFANLFGSLRSILFPACPSAISSCTRVGSAAAKWRISGTVFLHPLQWDPQDGVARGCRGSPSPQ